MWTPSEKIGQLLGWVLPDHGIAGRSETRSNQQQRNDSIDSVYCHNYNHRISNATTAEQLTELMRSTDGELEHHRHGELGPQHSLVHSHLKSFNKYRLRDFQDIAVILAAGEIW